MRSGQEAYGIVYRATRGSLGTLTPQELAALAGTEIALKHAAMVLLQLRLELVEVDHGIVVVPGWV